MSLRSPLSKAVGLGSAGHGFSHWWWQRVTAVALIPLGLWFVFNVINLFGAPFNQVNAWLSAPLNATLMLLFVLTALYHGQTGLQVVIEDYIHTKWLNLTLLLLIKFAAAGMAVFSVISILKVSLGA